MTFRATRTPLRPAKRPFQAFFSSEANARKWIDLTLASPETMPGDTVTLYAYRETEIFSVTKPQPDQPKPK